ncbi:MAG: hypothetical protein WEE89_13370 [Gemmatimonadota bacterium]
MKNAPPRVLDLEQWPPTKRFAIVSPFAVIGYTNLEFPIAYRARAAGFLQIADGYAAVRDVFRLYRRAIPGDRELLQRYVRERDALRLTVQDGGTLPLAASVELINEWIDGRVVAHVVIQDGRYWSSRAHLT